MQRMTGITNFRTHTRGTKLEDWDYKSDQRCTNRLTLGLTITLTESLSLPLDNYKDETDSREDKYGTKNHKIIITLFHRKDHKSPSCHSNFMCHTVAPR